MAAIFEVVMVYCSDTLGVENFDEIALSPKVKEIEAILCFGIFYLALKWPSLDSELKAKAKIVTQCRHPLYAHLHQI